MNRRARGALRELAPIKETQRAPRSLSGLLHRINNALDGQRNTTVAEFVQHKGSFRATTVNGQVTGHGLDLGVVDDPIKGRAEASSKTIRDKTWNWLVDDFFSRFSDHAGLLMIMTRWHVDDPVGRWLERFPDTKVLSYQAIADKDDWSVREGQCASRAARSTTYPTAARSAEERSCVPCHGRHEPDSASAAVGWRRPQGLP